MRTNQSTEIVTIGRREAKQFTIDPVNFAHIAGVLSSLYPRPIEAITREYSTNARDSHIAAGQTRPISVGVNGGVFYVEDFGLGLTVDELEGIWTEYGSSTKRDSDDTTGALGLGSKSAFTYADQFTITARKDGVQAIGVNSKDEAGVPVFEIIDTCSTTEPNGVRIEIPLKRTYDASSFLSAAHELFRHWEPGTVLVNGEPVQSLKERDDALVVDPEVRIYPVSYEDPILLMGGVPYAIRHDGIRQLLDHNQWLVVEVPLGTLGINDFTPSRDELKMTPHTQSVLQELHDYLKVRIPQRFEEMVAAAPTPWEGLRIQSTWKHRVYLQSKGRTFDISRGYRRGGGYGMIASKNEGGISVSSLQGRTVVLGFNRKSVSQRHKDILAHNGIESCILAPSRIGTEIEGHPATLQWKDLVDATPKPKRDRSSGPTTYSAVETGGLLTEIVQGDEIETDHIFYVDGEARSYANATKIEAAQYLGIFPQGTWTIVGMRSTQIDKFCRLYPEAKAFYNVYAWDEVLSAAKKASTETIFAKAVEAAMYDHRYSYRSNRVTLDGLRYADPAEIADPDLAEAVRWSQGEERTTDELTALKNLGATKSIPQPTDEQAAYIARILTAAKAYPLLGQVTSGVQEELLQSLLRAVNNEYRIGQLQGR